MKLAIADPPYLGKAVMWYGERRTKDFNEGGNVDPTRKADRHPDAAAWDDPTTHRDLVRRLVTDYDGWAIALLPDNLYDYLQWVPRDTRIAVWHDDNVMPTGATRGADGSPYSSADAPDGAESWTYRSPSVTC